MKTRISPMIAQLERAVRIREWIAHERKRSRPDAVKLLRLNALYLRLKARLNGLTAERLIRMSSAPRFTPSYAVVAARRR